MKNKNNNHNNSNDNSNNNNTKTTQKPTRSLSSWFKKLVKNLILTIVKFALLFFLPFFVLIRGAVFFHTRYDFFPWLSILCSAFLASVVLLIYISWISRRLTGKFGKMKMLFWRLIVVCIIVFGYCLHGIVFLSDFHMKDESIKKEYKALHPILRLAISTIVIFDEKLLITDTVRDKREYTELGVKNKTNSSLHFWQKDGYSHAVDIRTENRFIVRNYFIQSYFWIMGFKTLRHSGTEDHLHISLVSHSNPESI